MIELHRVTIATGPLDREPFTCKNCRQELEFHSCDSCGWDGPKCCRMCCTGCGYKCEIRKKLDDGHAPICPGYVSPGEKCRSKLPSCVIEHGHKKCCPLAPECTHCKDDLSLFSGRKDAVLRLALQDDPLAPPPGEYGWCSTSGFWHHHHDPERAPTWVGKFYEDKTIKSLKHFV